ncbi:MAG: hypothetical protein GC168_13995 [Candidatus Hydrogenedens sp.]|nr:hypothetical protein [Candidatus Hydrogenedens sp.]
MPCLAASFDPAIGPLLRVGLLPLDEAEPVYFHALIDTGASRTCISMRAAEKAGLLPSGMVPMISATEVKAVNTYLTHLVFPFHGQPLVQRGVFLMEFFQDENAPFQILLGRDILGRGQFSMSLDGHFVFSL